MHILVISGRRQLKGSIPYDCNYNMLEKTELENKKMSGCQGCVVGLKWIGRAQEMFRASVLGLCYIHMGLPGYLIIAVLLSF